MVTHRANTVARTTVACVALLLSGCPSSDAIRNSLPPTLELIRDPPTVAEVGKGNMIRYSCLFGSDGSIWAFGYLYEHGETDSARIVWTRYDGGSWSRPRALFVNDNLKPGEDPWFTTVLSETGQAMILWTPMLRSQKKPAGNPLLLSIWEGENWSSARSVSAYLAPGGFPPLVSARDRDGRTHCIYSGYLLPRESYQIGWLIAQGFFPAKPFHMIMARGRWSKPRAIVARSRWGYNDYGLGVGVSGLHLVAEAYHGTYLRGLFGSPYWIEHRVFSNGRWSAPDRISDSRGSVFTPTIAEDAAGNLHLVYRVYRETAPTVSRYRMKRAGVWLPSGPLGQNGYGAIITNDRDGNVYCYWAEGKYFTDTPPPGHLQVWNAKAASRPVTVPFRGDARFFRGPEGGVYLAWRTRRCAVESVAIQRLRVKRTRSGSPEPP